MTALDVATSPYQHSLHCRLWRVVGNAELARSPLVLSFLELSEAARVIPHTPAPVPQPQATSQQQVQQGQLQQQQHDDGVPALEQHTGQQQERAHIVAEEVLGAAAQQRHMRLGFRIEQRMHLRKHLKLLRQQLNRAAAELQACL